MVGTFGKDWGIFEADPIALDTEKNGMPLMRDELKFARHGAKNSFKSYPVVLGKSVGSSGNMR